MGDNGDGTNEGAEAKTVCDGKSTGVGISGVEFAEGVPGRNRLVLPDTVDDIGSDMDGFGLEGICLRLAGG